MALEVRRATRKKAKLRLGISAPAGAGKTMGALLVAYGITGDWDKIGLVDTENGSGELYVNHRVPGSTTTIGEYLYVRLDPPYAVAKYIEAQKALEEAGCEVVILDSISHAWTGVGGLLDKHGKTANQAGNNTYTAWRTVSPEHNRFIDTMLQSPAHIIATMRARVAYSIEDEGGGRKTVKKLGMAPVQREGMDYEFTVVLDIGSNHAATASKDRTSLFDGEFFVLSPDVGKRLSGWLNAGVEAPPTVEEPGKREDEFLSRVEAALSEAENMQKVNRITTHHEVQSAIARFTGERLERLTKAIEVAKERVTPKPVAAEEEAA